MTTTTINDKQTANIDKKTEKSENTNITTDDDD